MLVKLWAWFCNKPYDTNWQGFETRSKQTYPIQNGFETLPNDQTVAQNECRWNSEK